MHMDLLKEVLSNGQRKYNEVLGLKYGFLFCSRAVVIKYKLEDVSMHLSSKLI